VSVPTKYPVTYYSESKKRDVALEDMATPHILHAWRKLGGEDAPGVPAMRPLLVSMETELESRGCTYDAETGQWTLPAKLPPGEATP
jgi:hypothetical protein